MRVIQTIVSFVLDNLSTIVDYSIVVVVFAGLVYLYKQVKAFK